MKSNTHFNWSRRLTLNERLYRINESLCPPGIIHYVVHGRGKIEPNELQEAIDMLISKTPALKLKLQGNMWTFNGPGPKLIIHDHAFPEDWNDSVFTSTLNPNNDGCCEIHLFQADRNSILFRVLHSAMDGVGGLTVLECLFALLNGLPCDVISHHPKDNEVRKSISDEVPNKRENYRFNCHGLNQRQSTKYSNQCQTAVINLDSRIDGVIGLVGHWHMVQTQQPARFLIPVNLRRHKSVETSVANLSLPIYLNMDLHQTSDEIQTNLLTQLAANNELAKDPLEWFGTSAPDWLLKRVLRKRSVKAQATNRYPMSGFLSDLGKINLQRFTTSSFEADDVFALPTYTSLTPFCLIACHHDNGARIAIRVPQHYDIKVIKDSLTEFLTSQITTKIPEDSSLKPNHANHKPLLEIWSKNLNISESNIGLTDTFSDLGGASIDLLILLSEVEETLIDNEDSPFMSEALKLAGKISIVTMADLLNSPKIEL